MLDGQRRTYLVKLAIDRASYQRFKNVSSLPRAQRPRMDASAYFDSAVKKRLEAAVEQRMKEESAKATAGLKKELLHSAAKGVAIGAPTAVAGYLWKKYTDRKPGLLAEVGSSARRALGYGAGAGAIMGGIWGASKLIDHFKEPVEKKKAFNAMMDENPGLKQEEPKVVSRSFNTLYTFNRDMAKDPTVAGSFVRRAAAFKDEGIQAADIKTIAEIRKSLSDSRLADNRSGGREDLMVSTAPVLMGFAPK